MDSIALYLRYIRISLRCQLQYRASFIMSTVGGFFVNSIEFVGIWLLFSRFGTLRGWNVAEVALFYGMISLSFASALGFARGFDTFAVQVISGDFDRTLLRPRTTFFQVLAHDFQLVRSGRLTQGLLVVSWALANLTVSWTAAKLILFVASILSGIALFTGLIVIQATMCFWTTQTLEVMNSFTDGGVETARWPMSIYDSWFVKIFIFVIPLACVNYFPVLAILGRDDVLNSPTWVQWISPAAGPLFLAMALAFWRFGVRHYRSTGS